MTQKLSNYQCLAYAMPVVATSCLIAPIGVLQGIYAKYYGLSLTTIATVLLLTRLFDAITDPLIGYYADRYYQRSGTYKPFIFAGGLLFILCGYFLYLPPIDVNALYFTVWLMAFYLAWTLFEVPHLAWPSELARSSEDKSRIYTFRNMANYGGWLLFYVIPLLPIFESRAITPETLKVLVLVVAILMVPLFGMCLKAGFNPVAKPEASIGPDRVKRSSKTLIAQKQSFFSFLLSLVKNKPLVIFIGAYLTVTISSGLWYGLIFLYVDVYLGLGEYYAQMFLIAFIVGFAVTPLWYKVSIIWGKKTTWMLATLLLLVSFIYTGLLSPSNTSFSALVTLKTIQTLGFTCMNIMAPAILSEIIDYSNWKHRSEKSATYFSIYTFMTKTTIAIATALGLAIAGWYGFDAAASSHSEQSVFGLTLAIAWLPPTFAVVALIFIYFLPINERRHRIIRRKLDLMVARQNPHKHQEEVNT